MPKKEKRDRFVQEYLKDLNATQAYLRAYPHVKERTARQSGYELLTNPDIRDRIARAKDARARRTQVDQDRVVKELASIAFLERLEFGDGLHNKVKALETLLKHVTIQNEAAVKSQPVSFSDLMRKAQDSKKKEDGNT